MGCTPPDLKDLTALEHTLRHTKTRHDRALSGATFAPAFHECGRSGCRHARDDLLRTGETQTIDVTLRALTVTDLGADIALVTYRSELRRPTGTEWANRSCLRDRRSGRWHPRFHQGTQCEAPT